MATKETAKTETKSTKKAPPKKAAPKKTAPAKVDAPVKEDNVVEEKVAFVPKKVPSDELVSVVNGFQGKLIYKSPRSQEKFVWDEFGDVQDMELRELQSIKSSHKDFFVKNWIMFDEDNEWVIPYLGLNRYYENSIKLEDFEDILSKPISEIKDVISNMPKGQKKSLAYKARDMVESRELDSISKIETLEKLLDTELIEK